MEHPKKWQQEISQKLLSIFHSAPNKVLSLLQLWEVDGARNGFFSTLNPLFPIVWLWTPVQGGRIRNKGLAGAGTRKRYPARRPRKRRGHCLSLQERIGDLQKGSAERAFSDLFCNCQIGVNQNKSGHSPQQKSQIGTDRKNRGQFNRNKSEQTGVNPLGFWRRHIGGSERSDGKP